MKRQIIPEIKRNFLILGFTGPLRSGCSTAAKFYVNELENQIEQYISTETDDQRNIEETYKEIAALQIDAPEEGGAIEVKKHRLNELLKRREIKKVLRRESREGTIPPFYYISMSEMLLKFAIEYFLINKKKSIDKKYIDIVDFIKEGTFDTRSIRKINLSPFVPSVIMLLG